jgi:hypothetical protein
MSTGDRTIAEASTDSTWGIGLNVNEARNGAAWRGKNLLGVCLQKIRAGLRAREPYSNFRHWDVWVPEHDEWMGPITGPQILASGSGTNTGNGNQSRIMDLVAKMGGTPEVRPHVQRRGRREERTL